MTVEEIITLRMKKRIPFELLSSIFTERVYIGGNSCNRNAPNDLDIFPSFPGQFDPLRIDAYCASKGLKVLSRTMNALTCSYKGDILQFCNYYHPSLLELILSFDFAHVQVGCTAWKDVITDVQYSPDWEQAHLIQSSFYTGSKYPLSSLIRLIKYERRGEFAGKQYVAEVLKILTAIVSRGFDGYQDFKNQLDAVDLGLLPEDMKECSGELADLFYLLDRSQSKEVQIG